MADAVLRRPTTFKQRDGVPKHGGRSLLFFLLAFAFMGDGGRAADEKPVFYHQDVELQVTAAQLEKLEAIDAKHFGEIARQTNLLSTHEEKTLHEAKALRDKVLEIERARDAEIEASLTPEQQRRLQDGRIADLREQVDREVRFLRDIAPIVVDIAKADTLVVYEGLPRLDENGIRRETAEHKTFQKEGYYFYAEPLGVRPGVVERLRKIVANYRSFLAYGGPKFCGGYHPDLCLEWRTQDQVHRVYLCFGCHEGQFVGPKYDYMVDIDEPAYEELFKTAVSLFKHRNWKAEIEP